MTTEEFISTIFFQINYELNLGFTFEEIHLCRKSEVIAVRGSHGICKNHHLIHNFTKDEIIYGIKTSIWKRIIKNIDKVKCYNRINSSKNCKFSKENILSGMVQPNLKKFFRDERKKSESVTRDASIVNEPWNIL